MQRTCKNCGKPYWRMSDATGLCAACQDERAARGCSHCGKSEGLRELPEGSAICEECLGAVCGDIVLTTEGKVDFPISERAVIITAECVSGMNLFKDVFALGRDVFGGRSASAQKVLRDARNLALSELKKEAALLGANAVIAVDLDYSEISGGGKTMLFLVASGTAVRAELGRSREAGAADAIQART